MNIRSCVHHFVDDGCLYGTSIAAAPNGQLLACGSNSGVVNLYDISTVAFKSTPQPLKILLNLTTSCTSLKFNPTSEILAMGSAKKPNAVRLVSSFCADHLLMTMSHGIILLSSVYSDVNHLKMYVNYYCILYII